MANITRTAKSGRQWTYKELSDYRITVVDADLSTFLQLNDLPPPLSAPDVVLKNLDKPDGFLELPDIERHFFLRLGYAEHAAPSETSSVALAAHVLTMMGYEDDDTLLSSRPEPTFLMAGRRVDAKIDLCLRSYSKSTIILLIQEAKSVINRGNPEAQVIAGACAAFSSNNLQLIEAGLQPLENQCFPAVLMAGTAPIFYRIPVTQALIDALSSGTCPPKETVVCRFTPTVPDQDNYKKNGMRPLDNRRIILQCFEAFKAAIH